MKTTKQTVTPDQRSLKPGEVVEFQDNSVRRRAVVSIAPWESRGTWLVGLAGRSGGFNLEHVTKLNTDRRNTP